MAKENRLETRMGMHGSAVTGNTWCTRMEEVWRRREKASACVWTPKEGEWHMRAAWAFTILEIIEGEVEWVRDMVGPVVTPAAPEHLREIDIGCKQGGGC
jgi:hypothetical protein